MHLNTMTSSSSDITPSRSSSRLPLLRHDDTREIDDEPDENSSKSSSLLSDLGGNSVTSPTSSESEESAKNKRQKLVIQQGVVLLEDAIHYRSIHHKMDSFSITLYRWYHSAPVQWSVYAVIFLLLILAFLEDPSSLSWSSDPRRHEKRYHFPFGLIEGIDFTCLFLLLLSTIIQSYLAADVQKKTEFPKKHPWITGSYIVLLLSITDLILSLSLGNQLYRWRFRRLLRPYFLAGSSTMLKKTLKCIRNTLTEIASVLTLMLLHVYFFMMLGMLIFPQGGYQKSNSTHSELNNTEWREYFSSIDKAFTSLLVLLTTANNPDVMMPSYSQNRFYAIYFIVFSLIGTFLIFNLLTAVVYNQFRGYFQNSMQASHFRRCVAFSAAYAVLTDDNEEPGLNISSEEDQHTDSHRSRSIDMKKIRRVVTQVSMRPEQRTAIHHNLLNLGSDLDSISKVDFQQIFTNIDSMITSEILRPTAFEISDHSCRQKVQIVVLHPAFNIIGNLMVLVNAILVTVEIAIHYEKSFREVFSRLNIVNYAFAGYYLVEQTLKVIALGKRYFLSLSDVYDGMITVALLVVETVQLARYSGRPQLLLSEPDSGISLWDCARIINILVILRLLRIIPNFKPMAVVTSTLLEIMRNLSSFAGILAIIYYVFAIIGMILFAGKTDPPPHSTVINGSLVPIASPSHYECGTYEQLQYWANNFNDFASSLVVLWDIMVVNNWGVFLEVYTRRVGVWSQLYFITWWVVSVVISVNLFIALILDHFIAKWDRAHEAYNTQRLGRRGTVQALFLSSMHEPSPAEISDELLKHPSLRWCATST